MRHKRYKLYAVLLFGLGIVGLQAQTLDRIAISSGGISSDTINATVGEIFVFSATNNNISIVAGSQSDNSNTGGLNASISQTEVTQTTYLVYPNPVSDLLNLKIIGLNSETIAFQVYDITGKMVWQQTLTENDQTFKINVVNLSPGNYIINGYSISGEKIKNIKFIKL